MKVLWLSNIAFSFQKLKATASWLQPMAEQLAKSVEMVNVSDGQVNQPTVSTFNNIKQWVIPFHSTCYGQEASEATCLQVQRIIDEEKPDLVHLWGTEKYWASIYRKGYIHVPTILDIQGLLAPYTDYYYGGLSWKEIVQSIHLKEVLMPWRTLFHKREVFRKRGICETRNIKSFKYIAYQSQWVKNYLSYIHPSASLFPTKIILRKGFYESEKWEYKKTDAPVVFSTCSAAVSYKGMHIVIKAIALLKLQYPHIKLKLAGNINVGNKLLDGYSIFLNNLIKKYGLQENVIYLGSLDETQIINNLQQANVCVIPSFVETYCLAFAESMMVGTPTIASYAGAMPELAVNGEEAFFYNSMDYYSCATLIDKVIQDKKLAEHLSENGRARRMRDNDITAVVSRQIEIYKEVLEYEHNKYCI